MRIITDSREQKNQHILEKFSNKNIPFKVKKLDFADYSIEGFENKVAVERKSGLNELTNCFCSGRKRFAAEFERAKEAGAKMYLIVEDEQGKDKMIARQEMEAQGELTEKQQNKTWRGKFRASSMIASLSSWKVKYDLEIIFCNKKKSGEKIIEIFNAYLQQNSTLN